MATTCTGGEVACWIASQVNVLTNLANSMLPVEKMLIGGAYLMGLLFVFKSITSFKTYGEAKTSMSGGGAHIKEPLTFLMVGVILLYFPTSFKIFMQTSFGYSSVLQYAPINSGSDALNTLFGNGSAVGEPLSIIIRVIGLIAFIRGWVLISRSASQGQPPGGTGKGFMHIFGGILAMNIVGTLNVINNTLYGT